MRATRHGAAARRMPSGSGRWPGTVRLLERIAERVRWRGVVTRSALWTQPRQLRVALAGWGAALLVLGLGCTGRSLAVWLVTALYAIGLVTTIAVHGRRMRLLPPPPGPSQSEVRR